MTSLDNWLLHMFINYISVALTITYSKKALCFFKIVHTLITVKVLRGEKQ